MSPKKIWNLIPPSPQAPRLALETGISRLKAQLLLNRNITDSDSAAIFLSPRLSHLADPMLLKDMDRAIDLVLKSVEKREPITVYGDYDADGLTATALLLNFFWELGVSVSFYIPNRLGEGYSLNPDSIRRLAQRGTRLIITVDCGISNLGEISLAKDLGMKIVVTDHHQIPEGFYPLCPVINPNRPDSLFPFKDLAGVGVAFFFILGLRAALRNRGWFRDIPEPDLKRYLDLVAIGTVADMVPLKGLNRILVQSGIEVMRDSKWHGLNALKDVSGVKNSDISSYDLAFKLAPRLNAPGRMGDAETGLRALTADLEPLALEAAKGLNSMNIQRQVIEKKILDEIEKTMIPAINLKNRRTLVLAREGWHRGVLGIVASKLLDKYHRPAFIFTIHDGIATGSGRSINGLNLHSAMTRLDSLFEKFGGHYHAAGCTMKAVNIKNLAKGLEEIAIEELCERDLIPSVEVDMEMSLGDLTMETIKQIQTLEPFGSGNPEPVFYAGSLEVLRSWIVDDRHLKLKLRQGDHVMEAIGFGLGNMHPPLEGGTINAIFSPEINTWRGYRKIQLRISDLEIKGDTSKLCRSDDKIGPM